MSYNVAERSRMRNLHKITNTALIFTLIGVVLFTTDLLYALRPPMQCDDIIGKSKKIQQKEKLWGTLQKATEKIKAIISGDFSEYPDIEKYYKINGYYPEIINVTFPEPTACISPDMGHHPLEIEPEAQLTPTIYFSQAECIIVYKKDKSDYLLEADEFEANNFEPCFVAYFFAAHPEDNRKILIAFHLSIMPNDEFPEIPYYYQLFRFVETIISDYGIKKTPIVAAFYGNDRIKISYKVKIIADFNRVFPNSALYHKNWGMASLGVSARVHNSSLTIASKIIPFSLYNSVVYDEVTLQIDKGDDKILPSRAAHTQL